MVNTVTGEVRCEVCGKLLGNYLAEDFFRLIRTKYCPECFTLIRKEQLNAAQRARRRRLKNLTKKQDTVIQEMEQMNLLLREQIKLLQDENARLNKEARE